MNGHDLANQYAVEHLSIKLNHVGGVVSFCELLTLMDTPVALELIVGIRGKIHIV